MSARVAIARVSLKAFGDMLRAHRPHHSDLPKGAEVVEIYRDDCDRLAGTFSVLLHCEEFDEVPEGERAPERTIAFYMEHGP